MPGPCRAPAACGAQVNIHDRNGTPPLSGLIHWEKKDPGQALILLKKFGADPSLVDTSGNTLLHCVAMNTKPGGPERLRTALSVTRTLDTRNTSGFSALDLARKYRNASVATGLMAAGARQATAE